jgi:DnaJ-class molecular chaperone
MNYASIITVIATTLGTDVDTLLKSAMHENPCFLCFGSGKNSVTKLECPHCNGKGFLDEEESE